MSSLADHRPTTTYKEKITQPTKVQKNTITKHHSKAPIYIIGGLIILIVIIWSVILIVMAVNKTGFFSYTRPGTLPGQVGSTIDPTTVAKTFTLPAVDLLNKTIFLGGPTVAIPEKDAQDKAFQDQIDAWNKARQPPAKNN